MAEHPNGANLIRFDENANTRFFSCRHCRNHVLSLENCIGREENLNAIICKDPVNVWAGDITTHWFIFNLPVVSMFCNVCNKNLGLKFVMVSEPNDVIQEGRFLLYPNLMVYWNGIGVFYADTNQPVFDN